MPDYTATATRAGRGARGAEHAARQAGADVRVFFGNLDFSVTAKQLQELLASNGLTPTRVEVLRKSSGQPAGCGFANFSETDAARAVELLHGRDFIGRPLRIERARQRTIDGSRVTLTETGHGMTRICVGGLRVGAKEEDVRELLASCGVTRAHIEMGPRRSAERPYAFAKIPLRQAKDVIESLNGKVISGMKLRAGPALTKFRQRACWQNSESTEEVFQ